MKRVLYCLIFLFVTISGYGQLLNGRYCCDNNWLKLDFKSKDSLIIIKPYYFSGHLPGLGVGGYKVKGDSIYINYRQNADTASYNIVKIDGLKSDSLTIRILNNDPIFYYSKSKNKFYNWMELIKNFNISPHKIERINDDLVIECEPKYIVIPASVIMNKNVMAIEIKNGKSGYIEEKSDRFYFKIFSPKKIQVNNKILLKDNCEKKPTPVF